MKENLILLPLLAQVGLTIFIWFWMFYTRTKEIISKKIALQSIATKKQADKVLKEETRLSDNLINLFEVPVLFYVLCILLYITNSLGQTTLYLLWAFVCFRYIHSFIHVTYNNVMHRFLAYFTSSICLWCAWIIFTARTIWGIEV